MIGLYGQGLTTGGIQAHLEEIYDTSVSRETISKITDGIVADMAVWQNRTARAGVRGAGFDAIVVKVRDSGVANRPVYVAIGVDLAGERDVGGGWLGPAGGEGAAQWAAMLTEPANRGVADAPVVCCDGLGGLPHSIRATWPQATVQTSLVHDGLAPKGSGCHPRRRERTSADRPPRSRRRPVPLVDGGPRTANRELRWGRRNE